MESIKEEELNLQREVVTTTPNTWLVEAVNPTTGEKKMINVSNFASVVAGVLGNPLGWKGQLTSSDDLNDIGDGIYWMADTNNPQNCVEQYNNILIQLAHQRKGTKMQVLYSGNSGLLFYRGLTIYGWQGWNKVESTSV